MERGATLKLSWFEPRKDCPHFVESSTSLRDSDLDKRKVRLDRVIKALREKCVESLVGICHTCYTIPKGG